MIVHYEVLIAFLKIHITLKEITTFSVENIQEFPKVF